MVLTSQLWKFENVGTPVFMRPAACKRQLGSRVARPFSGPHRLFTKAVCSRVFPTFAVPGNPLEIQERHKPKRLLPLASRT